MGIHGDGIMNERETVVPFDINLNQLVNIDYLRKIANHIVAGKTLTLVETKKALTNEFYEYLKPYRVYETIMCFIQQPRCLDQQIHVDRWSEDETCTWSFNILINGQGSCIFYKQPDFTGKFIKHKRSPTILYELFSEDKLEKIAEWDKHKAALIRIDVPHGVVNRSDELRIAICVRVNEKLSWEEAKDVFGNFPAIKILKNEIQ